MNATLLALAPETPLHADNPLSQLPSISEEELGITFEALAAIAAEQPDNELARQTLGSLVLEAQISGNTAAALQMAVTIGAMACLHPHLQDTANEIASLFSNDHEEDDGHGHDKSTQHNSSQCADCKSGRICWKRR